MVAAAKYAVGLNKEISDCGNSLTKTPYAMTSYVNDDSWGNKNNTCGKDF